MPAWRDDPRPEVAANRAVIPSSVTPKALFYLMMADGSTESTPIDPPDVFSDQPTLLSVVSGGTAAGGGSVNPEQMHSLELQFHCHGVGYADVHVEISFNNVYYPADFAFTYACEAVTGGGGIGFFSFLIMIGFFYVVGGAAC